MRGEKKSKVEWTLLYLFLKAKVKLKNHPAQFIVKLVNTCHLCHRGIEGESRGEISREFQSYR